jgi:hypothetical protein
MSYSGEIVDTTKAFTLNERYDDVSPVGVSLWLRWLVAIQPDYPRQTTHCKVEAKPQSIYLGRAGRRWEIRA